MKPLPAAVFIASIMLMTGPVLALSDIEVNDVEYSAATERIVAIMKNNGPGGSGAFAVDFYLGGEKIGDALSQGIESGESDFVFVDYPLQEGRYTVRAVADPGSQIDDANRGNNDISLDIVYGEAAEVVPVSGSQELRASAVQIGVAIIAIAFAVFLVLRIRKMHVSLPKKKSSKKLTEIWDDQRKYMEGVKKKVAEPREKEMKKEIAVSEKNEKKEDIAPERKDERKDDMKKIGDAIRMPIGSKVKFEADVEFYDKIGSDYAYFLRGGGDEIIGFSKNRIEKKRAVISGTCSRFMEQDTAVNIEEVS